MPVCAAHDPALATNAVSAVSAVPPAAHPGASSGLARVRIDHAKRAYTTRRVALGASTLLLTDPTRALKAGDVVLARVDRVGKHAALEGPAGRRQSLFEGDEIVVACAARYAPDQFDARVPAVLGAVSPGRRRRRGRAGGGPPRRARPPTELTLLGASGR
jgi:hypothetical protein